MMDHTTRSGRSAALGRWIRPGALIRTLAIVLVLSALAVTTIQLHNTESANDTPASMPPVATPLAGDLLRCRSVTAEELAADDTCRRVWAENRRRFFRPQKPAETR